MREVTGNYRKWRTHFICFRLGDLWLANKTSVLFSIQCNGSENDSLDGGDGICTKTFGKSERAYQGGRLDKPHKFPGNVGRMTSSRRSSRGVDSGPLKTQQEDKHKCTHTASMNYHPSLISLSTEELPKAWRASQEKENFSMYAWDPAG